MDEETIRRRIEEATAQGTCPQCRKLVPQGSGYGPGQHQAGYFCSVECYMNFYKDQILERHRRVQPSPNGQ